MTNLQVLAALECASERRWVGARLEPRKDQRGNVKLTKVPVCAFDPRRPASSTDPRTWSTFGTAADALTRGLVPHIGFVFAPPFVGIDLDGCRNTETGAIEPWAQEIIGHLDSYTEASLSGTGVHIICRGGLPPGGRRKGAIEMYDAARFFVMTGRAL